LKPLRIVFAGTPDFAASSLRALLDSSHDVIAVLTQPDRPAGRGRKLLASPVKQMATQAGVPVYQPESLRNAEIAGQLTELKPDVMVVVAYGLLVPEEILSLPAYGCINVHGSLLPRWRGAAPVQRAIAAGDAESGITIMQMEKGLDTGPMLEKVPVPLAADDTGGSLHDKLAEAGAKALVAVLDELPTKLAAATPQPEDGVTYAHKLSKREAQLDWQLSAVELARRVRAFNPWPVAWVPRHGQPLRIWQARAESGGGSPGTIIDIRDEAVVVATGDGALAITCLQLPGKKPVSVTDLLRGHAQLFHVGEPLGDD
jgi:methionyl-tRNA formyltransferase